MRHTHTRAPDLDGPTRTGGSIKIAESAVNSDDQIRVCCVFVCRDSAGRLLLHRRTEACRDEAGTWDCGGGQLEFGEDPVKAVRREVREEYGVSVRRVRARGVRNVVRQHEGDRTHWVALIFDVLIDPDEVRIGEPQKMAELAWFDIDGLPTPLHSQLRAHLMLLPQGRASSPRALLTRLSRMGALRWRMPRLTKSGADTSAERTRMSDSPLCEIAR